MNTKSRTRKRGFQVGYREELTNRILYEFSVLDELRRAFYYQHEDAESVVKWKYGEQLNGQPQLDCYTTCSGNYSESAIRLVYEKLRPLHFITGYKLHDLIVEWILNANGFAEWEFKKRYGEYVRLRRLGILREPDEFKDFPEWARAFWELYSRLRPYRGTLTHGSSFQVLSNGDLVISKGKNQTLTLSTGQQASYVRIICLFSEFLTREKPLNTMVQDVIDNAFESLKAIHKRTRFTRKNSRIVALEVTFSEDLTISQTEGLWPIIDCSLFARHLAVMYPTGPNGRLLFSLEISASVDGQMQRWIIPIEQVPSDRLIVNPTNPLLAIHLMP